VDEVNCLTLSKPAKTYFVSINLPEVVPDTDKTFDDETFQDKIYSSEEIRALINDSNNYN